MSAAKKEAHICQVVIPLIAAKPVYLDVREAGVGAGQNILASLYVRCGGTLTIQQKPRHQ